VSDPIPAVGTCGDGDVLVDSADPDVLLVSIGSMADLCRQTADRLADQGISVRVVDPRWVLPIDSALVDACRDVRLVAVVEDGLRDGGIGSRLRTALEDAGVETPVRTFGLPTQFLDHGGRADVLAAVGLTAQEVSRTIVETTSALLPTSNPEVAHDH
jgi:1-deoxy-D-xylulose-5-phosphate synthase